MRRRLENRGTCAPRSQKRQNGVPPSPTPGAQSTPKFTLPAAPTAARTPLLSVHNQPTSVPAKPENIPQRSRTVRQPWHSGWQPTDQCAPGPSTPPTSPERAAALQGTLTQAEFDSFFQNAAGPSSVVGHKRAREDGDTGGDERPAQRARKTLQRTGAFRILD